MKQIARALALLFCAWVSAEPLTRCQVSKKESILPQIEKARPSKGGPVPANLASRLGATHSNGFYFVTKKPFLIEGAEQLSGLGFGVAKFWLSHDVTKYGWNSNWGDISQLTLAQLLDHPYYRQALSQPFTTVIFEVGTDSENFFKPDHDFASDTREMEEITVYLLKTYHDRDITFILQNWEGDWVFRGKDKHSWPASPDIVASRTEAMIKWFKARQEGVELGRAEVPGTKAKVLHAIEVNKVFDTEKGIPTLMSKVLPVVPVDLVSWSSWDAKEPSELWKGVEMLRHAAKPLPGISQTPVYIGEIGHAENTGESKTDIRKWWDERMAVLLALNVPYIVYWELYCNEPKDHDKLESAKLVPHTANQMTGKWLIRPDGSHSHALDYFEELLAKSKAAKPK